MIKISLAAARVNAKLSQDEVATELKVSKSTVVNWEKGRSSPKVDQFEKLCTLYKIPKDFIFLPSTLQKVEQNQKNAV